MRDIILKLDVNSGVLTKLTNVNPIKGTNQNDVYYLYAPYGNDVAKIKYLPERFINLTGVNPVPSYKMIQETDEEVILAKVPEADQEADWSLFYLPVTIGINSILQSFNASQYQVSFERLQVDEDDDNIGSYATASTVEATINTELKAQFPSAVENNYVNVYLTTSNKYTSWTFDGTDWADEGELINEHIIDTTQPYTETFKGTVFASDDYTTDYDPSDLAIQLNYVFSEIANLNDLVSALIGGEINFMRIEDYDTDGVATESVKYARNIGVDGNSVNYIDVLTKLGYLNQDVKTTSSPEFVDVTITGEGSVETKNNKNQSNGYVGLDSNAKMSQAQLPNGTKVIKGDFGDIAGDLPTVGVSYGDTYRCDSNDYTSAVSGDTYNLNDTATWFGSVWVKNDASDAVSTVNGQTGDVVLRANNINREDDSETIEQSFDEVDTSLSELLDKITFSTVTQDTTDKYKFYIDAVDTSVYARRIVFAEFPDTINEDLTGSDVVFSIDNGVTYNNVYSINGTTVTVDEAFKRGTRIIFVYDSVLGGYQPITTDKDFVLLAGSTWNQGETVSGNYNDIQVLSALVADIINALGSGGQIVRQVTELTVDYVATTTETDLVFDTVTTATNDASVITVDGSNNTVLLSENTSGYRLSALATCLGTQGNPNTTSIIRFNLYINGNATPSDTFDISMGKDEIVNKPKETTYVVPSGQAPDTLRITAELISGSATVQDFTVTAQSLFTTSGGVPGPADTTTTTVASINTEMLTPIVGGKQQDANEQFVSKLNEIGKRQLLVEVGSGQFKIDSNNPIADMNTYQFKFPEATADSDSLVELSVDNGTTYYDVEYRDTTKDLTVGDVSGQMFDLTFDSNIFKATHVNEPLKNDSVAYLGTSGAYNTGKEGAPVIIDRDSTVLPEPTGINYSQIVDGDLPTDNAEWTLLNVSGTADSFTATAQGGRITQTVSLIANKKYAILALVKASSADVRLQLSDNISSGGSDYHSGSGVYELLKTIVQIDNTTSSGFIGIRDDSSSGWAQVDTTHIMVIPVPNEWSSLSDTQILSNINPSDYIAKGLYGIEEYTQVSYGINNTNKLNYEAKALSGGIIIDGGDAVIKQLDNGVNVTVSSAFGLGNERVVMPSNTGVKLSSYIIPNTGEARLVLNEINISGETIVQHSLPNIATEGDYDISFTSDSETAYLDVGLVCEDSNGDINFTKLMITVSTYDGDYVSYEAPSTYKINTTLNYGDTRLQKASDIDETAVKNVSGWNVSSTITNTTSFFVSASSLGLDLKYVDSNSDKSPSSLLINNVIYPVVAQSNINSNDIVQFCVSEESLNRFYIRFNNSDLTTLDDAGVQAYLQSVDVKLIYPLATPISRTVDEEGAIVTGKYNTYTSQDINGIGVEFDALSTIDLNGQAEQAHKNTIDLYKKVRALEQDPFIKEIITATSEVRTNKILADDDLEIDTQGNDVLITSTGVYNNGELLATQTYAEDYTDTYREVLLTSGSLLIPDDTTEPSSANITLNESMDNYDKLVLYIARGLSSPTHLVEIDFPSNNNFTDIEIPDLSDDTTGYVNRRFRLKRLTSTTMVAWLSSKWTITTTGVTRLGQESTRLLAIRGKKR